MPSRRETANALRALAMDAVQAARSGHPGMPMGMADIAEVLWNDFLRHNPGNPGWWDRDRFVLSNGHGSMLQYGLLHLAGYDLPIEQLKNFRQLHSATPGHPERADTPGVETTTGPLGQGLANAVGMALAEKLLAARYNRDGHSIIDHYTYVFLGDGCLMEGISHEVCSLAGTLQLGKLIAFWDDNGISIDGPTTGWFTDDTGARFEAYGWHVIRDVDGHNAEAVKAAIVSAQALDDRPTLICCKTVIGFGAPNKQGTEGSHGAPLGADEIVEARRVLDWPHAAFVIPDEVRAHWDARSAGAEFESEWRRRYEAYQDAYPDLAAELERRMAGRLPDGFDSAAAAALATLESERPTVASRKASQMALEALAPGIPELLGGSADLTHSNLTWHKGSVDLSKDPARGNYLFAGVREFGMTALANGLAVHGGFLPYMATFLVFSDYARNAVRMSALLPAQVIHVYTHDSIGLGEDGPTHQPIEHLASLRLIPGLDVWRPCDAAETLVAWQQSIMRQDRPSALALSRQNLPYQHRSAEALASIERGGYVLAEHGSDTPALILIATGSELDLAQRAAAAIHARDAVSVRVVSMPSTTVFDRQPQTYRDQVLPPSCRRRIAIEAGVSDFWRKYVGLDGAVLGMDRFGLSAPAEALFDYFGFHVDGVMALADGLARAAEERAG